MLDLPETAVAGAREPRPGTGADVPTQLELLDRVFRDPATKQGLKFFTKGERLRIRLTLSDEGKVLVFCLKRQRWFRAKPEDVVRQLFLVLICESLDYSLDRIAVEWPIQMGSDSEKERADIVIFSDDASTDPYIVFELKKPETMSESAF
jgi:hypothetical protein